MVYTARYRGVLHPAQYGSCTLPSTAPCTVLPVYSPCTAPYCMFFITVTDRFIPNTALSRPLRREVLHRFVRAETLLRQKAGSLGSRIPPQRVFPINDTSFCPRSVSHSETTVRVLAPLFPQ